jgi:vacuolar-type H+-ATPase subunit I/STV1
VIILGLILLVIGFVIGVPALWTIGLILVVIGAILFLLGAIGVRSVAGDIGTSPGETYRSPRRQSVDDNLVGVRGSADDAGAAPRVLLGQAGCVAG